MKPIIFWDIDGVFNPYQFRPTQAWPKRAWREGQATAAGETYPLSWAVPVIEYVSALVASGRAEHRWLTTWHTDAPAFAQAVGLPEFEVADAPEHGADMSLFIKQRILSGVPAWWKLPAVERAVGSGRPVIWVDDQITDHVPRRHRDELGRLGLIRFVSPDPDSGLCPSHLRKIDKFLAEMEDPCGAVTSS